MGEMDSWYAEEDIYDQRYFFSLFSLLSLASPIVRQDTER